MSVYGWVSNYQRHPLGFALFVKPLFTVGYGTRTSREQKFAYLEAFVPYLEHNKSVGIELFRMNREHRADVRLVGIEFYDLYDRRHQHWFGDKGTNALHGRLRCDYRDGRFTSIPGARPRGPKVVYDVETEGSA